MSEPVKKRRSTGGRDFQKGHDPRRSTSGRPNVDVLVRDIKADLRQKIATDLQKYHAHKLDDLNALMKSPDITVGEAMAISFLKQAILKGCEKRLLILAKIVGLETATAVHLEIETNPSQQITMKDVMEAMKKDKLLEHKKENDQCTEAEIVVETTATNKKL